jgi:hypothetical protein
MAHDWTTRNARPVAAARCGRSSALRDYGAPFLVFLLPMELVECEEFTKGIFYRWGGGGTRAGRAAARFKPQPSTTVGERSKGRLTARLDQMGAARNVEHRRRVYGAQGASHAAWR